MNFDIFVDMYMKVKHIFSKGFQNKIHFSRNVDIFGFMDKELFYQRDLKKSKFFLNLDIFGYKEKI